MQIGFDVGATKIESVVLEDTGQESFRERKECPKEYNSIISNIVEITKKLETKLNKSLFLLEFVILEFIHRKQD